jgi:iron(III) transport system permease protein
LSEEDEETCASSSNSSDKGCGMVRFLARFEAELKRPLRRRQGSTVMQEPLVMLVIVAIAISLLLFVIYPLYSVLKTSLMQSDGSIGLGVYRGLLAKSYNRRPLANSVRLGAIVAVVGTVIGFIFAYCTTRVSLPFSGFFKVVAMFPMISPPFIMSLATIMLFGNNGLITKQLLRGMVNFRIYGLRGLALVETLAYFPTAYLVLSGVLQAIDPSIEDAARDLGASWWQVFRTVTLPLAIPGIASALLLIFIESLADFGNPIILSGDYQVLAVQAYLRITGLYDLSGGAALAVILLVPSLIAFFVQKYWVSRKSYVTVTGKPSGQRVGRNEPWVRTAAFVICLILTGVILLFYGTAFVGSFMTLWGVNYDFTLANYHHVFQVAGEYIKDTLFLSTVATPITGILAMIIAFIVVRKEFFGRQALELTSMLSFAVSGTVVGIGYILAFNQPPILLTGTAAIIIILFVFRNMPTGIQSGIAALQQIDPSIEEASCDLGADSGTTFRKITLPLIAPAFFSGLVFSFVRCVTAISAIVFVVSGRWKLITVAVLGSVENSDLAQAAAFCVVIIAMVLSAIGIINLLVYQPWKRGPHRAPKESVISGGTEPWIGTA